MPVAFHGHTHLLFYIVDAAPTDACTGGPDAAGDCGGPNELCNAATSGVCECDAANGFEESGDPAACTLKGNVVFLLMYLLCPPISIIEFSLMQFQYSLTNWLPEVMLNCPRKSGRHIFS